MVYNTFFYDYLKLDIQGRPVITRWSGSTKCMRVIGEARYRFVSKQVGLDAVLVVIFGWGNARLGYFPVLDEQRTQIFNQYLCI